MKDHPQGGKVDLFLDVSAFEMFPHVIDSLSESLFLEKTSLIYYTKKNLKYENVLLSIYIVLDIKSKQISCIVFQSI